MQKEKKLKYVIIIRHGELNNPKKIVYNRDEVMKSEDIIHLSKSGKEQLRQLGNLILSKHFNCTQLYYGSQTRVVESAEELNKVLHISNIEMRNELNEVYAPGPYLEGLKINQWENKMRGNAYDIKRWGKYQHEKPQEIISRVNKIFLESVKKIKVGETAVFISHGDPIAWWLNWIFTGKIPDPKRLRSLIYPKKGQAIVVIINPQSKFFSHYFL